MPSLFCADPANWEALKAAPEGQNSPEWPIEQVRAGEAAARIFWPLGNTKLEKRLPLISAPPLLLWGSDDHLIPIECGRSLAKMLPRCELTEVPGSGHLMQEDAPEAIIAAALRFFAAS